MIHFLTATHGPLCHALVTSAKMVFGEVPHISCVSLSEDGGIEDFKVEFDDQIKAIAARKVDGIIVLCDLECGTPYNVACTYAFDDKFPVPVEVIAGVNFPTLLMSADFEDEKDVREVAKNLQREALNTIVHAQLPDDSEDNSEDF
ncbi:PTS fructose transporter subunit IIA [Vibrio sp. 99-8-1]|uniref:PTS sugar transporter subunit IIA n=1 Tax=Vibrio sp. 99-8-1 TaxID=2607602 RepID=UPI0014935B10|nr:PTS fructose transporter subunit IIA [Vibrio sp. 99-8-1]NOI65360.1 PTS fructose transporter subunit IIA [Vibrio sp. 99-8-1]